MKHILIFAFLMLKTMALLASDKTDVDWRTQVLANKLSYEDQAYCYTDEKGTLDGINVDLRIRLASVSKLVTSLWSVDVLGANFKHNTLLTIKDSELHFKGSFDPFMGNEKIFFLLSQLNDLGYTHFDKITFDKNFILFPNAEGHIEEHPVITPESIIKNLMAYFNTAAWTPAMKTEYTRVQLLAAPGRMRKAVNFSLNSAELKEDSPENYDRKLTLSSPPLYRYLKEMNVESNNYVAQILFQELGGEKYFMTYMNDNFRFDSKVIRFFSGSGLPTMINNIRYDNYATCESMLTLIQALKDKAERQEHGLEDIVAVPGSDQGTFRNRIFPADYKNAFVAKTGTLMHTSTLAGAMSTKLGLSFYGIFNQSKDIEGSKRVQNAMVASIMNELGGPKAFNYKVDPFDTYGDDNIKNLLKPRSEFFPVEENLY